MPGGVRQDIGKIVCQYTADFSYTKSFPKQRVVSIDKGPTLLKHLEHVEDDFIKTAKFAYNSQIMLIFEWFPGSEPGDYVNNRMLRALKPGVVILEPGGTLLIDSHPYFWFGTGELERVQLLNPFGLFLDHKEIGRIKVCLSLISAGKILPKADEIVAKAVNIASTIFKETEKATASNIHKSMVNNPDPDQAFRETTENPKANMFLWAYHSYSRVELMREALQKIGFDVANFKIEFLLENPFNHRKYAWFINVKKPMGASEGAGISAAGG